MSFVHDIDALILACSYNMYVCSTTVEELKGGNAIVANQLFGHT